jgi:hypothetical protein
MEWALCHFLLHEVNFCRVSNSCRLIPKSMGTISEIKCFIVGCQCKKYIIILNSDKRHDNTQIQFLSKCGSFLQF